jgi:FdhD protein
LESFEIILFQDGTRVKTTLPVSEEVPLTIDLNGRELATLLCSPAHIRNLVTGFLYTSGLLQRVESIRSLTVDRERWKVLVEMQEDGLGEATVFKRVYTSGCGKGVLFHNPMDLVGWYRLEDDFRTGEKDLFNLMKTFQKQSQEHTLTRGVHSSALASTDEILIFRDDIGRHNAIDKVIGEALYRGIEFSGHILLTSGRISSEILSKALRCRMPVIAAAGAPTNQAVKIARQMNITLLGRVRGSRMSLYSSEERIR